MTLDIRILSALITAKLGIAGYVFSMRELGRGEFGDGIEIEAVIGERNAVIDLWSCGVEGSGMITHVVFEDIVSENGSHIETRMIAPEVWLDADDKPERMADQVFQAVASYDASKMLAAAGPSM